MVTHATRLPLDTDWPMSAGAPKSTPGFRMLPPTGTCAHSRAIPYLVSFELHQPYRWGMSDWRTLSDQELIDAQFDIFDPEELEGVVLDLPPDYMASVLEGQYDTKKTTGNLVRCIHCKKPNHNHGFVFRTPQGGRILVGIDCGEKIYGVQFNQQQNDFNAARARRDALIARHYALEHGNELWSHAHDLGAHPAVALFKQARSEYLKAFPDLARNVVNACGRDGGALFVDVASRNYEAEAARDSRLDVREERLAKELMTKTERGKERRDIAAQRGTPIYKYTPTFIGTLAGQPFFLTTSPPPHTQIPELTILLYPGGEANRGAL